MCSDRHKNHDCGEKKLEGTSSAIFGVGTAAKCYELERLLSLLKRESPCDFAQKTRETAQGNLKCMRPHIGGPVVLTDGLIKDGRTDVRTDGHVTITSLPKFLGLIGYQICLAMVLRWGGVRTDSPITYYVKIWFTRGVVVSHLPCMQKTGVRILAGEPHFHRVCYSLPIRLCFVPLL